MAQRPQGSQANLLYRVHVFCCVHQRPVGHRRGCCADKGSRALCDYMCRLGMVRGIPRIRINHSGCLNVCEHGPVMVVYPEGLWYRYQSQADVAEIINSHLIHDTPVQRLMLSIDPSTLHG